MKTFLKFAAFSLIWQPITWSHFLGLDECKVLTVQFCPECLKCSCEQTLFNAPGEALALTDAARLFLTSEKENWALQAPGFDEHLQAALNCYSFAIKVQRQSEKADSDEVFSFFFLLTYTNCGILFYLNKTTGNRVSLSQWYQVYIEMNQPVMAASLCLELGNALKVKRLSPILQSPE